jgi:protein TonB
MKMLQRSIDVCEKSSSSNSEQSNRPKDEPENVQLTRPEIEPQFPGGEQAMLSFIKNNFNIPSELILEDPKSKIYVQFFVEVDGGITEISVVRGIHPLLDAEAIRVVSIMPKFNPAQNKGIPVRQSLVLPITLHLK